MRKDWRFFDTGESSGFFNMALDEAIFDYKEKNPDISPALRVFRWKPACLSIGRHQRIEEINTARCRELGIDVVRRLTGGTAILHKEELTYSIVISQDDGIPFGVGSSFMILNQGLIAAYHELGIKIDLIFHSERSFSPVCFINSVMADLSYQGRKIIGSAQARRGKTILQHGVLVIRHEPDLMLELLNSDDEQKQETREDFLRKTIDLEMIRGKTGWQEIKEAILKGFQEFFGLEFAESGLELEEKIELQKLISHYRRLE